MWPSVLLLDDRDALNTFSVQQYYVLQVCKSLKEQRKSHFGGSSTDSGWEVRKRWKAFQPFVFVDLIEDLRLLSVRPLLRRSEGLSK